MNKYEIQKRRVFKAFAERPKTMLEVARETGIERANICRYIAEFREADTVEVAFKNLCPITNHRANFYQTFIKT